MSEETSLPKELLGTSHQSIQQLKALKQEMIDKEKEIKEQSEDLELRLKKLTAGTQKIKINPKEKAAFEADCAHYQRALENVIQGIQSRIEGWEKFLSSQETKKGNVQLLAIYVHHNAQQTKKFIKKTRKDLSVIHSRFSYRFEIQKNHLSSLEHLVGK